ncbi:hypothetical protein PanWU01x14_305250 [Parasponia andersonii]|uniref:Uncharacterized protein n=1 Tax=Parasponia andersonii TaxID=3476 RepID=A0A2P5AS98_PARAD|nr:hypothetical protein PanWU01x14_305250 [Parasponia andersonii]
MAKLSMLFQPKYVQQVDQILILPRDVEDKLIWMKSRNDSFSIKGAYWALNVNRFMECNELWKLIWNSDLHERLKCLRWHIARGALSTGDELDNIFGIEV